MVDFVAAVCGPDKVELFLSVAEAKQTHPKAMVFDSWEKMVRIYTPSEMDLVRGRLLYCPVSKSKTAEEAAKLLWRTFALVLPQPGRRMLRKLPPKRDLLGNRKTEKFSNKTELLQVTYVPGQDPIQDVFYKKLARQARVMVDLLLEDGRQFFQQSEVLEIFRANADRIGTKQPIDVLWGWYCHKLVARRLVKKLGFTEYAELKALSRLK